MKFINEYSSFKKSLNEGPGKGYYIKVSVRDAKKALAILDDMYRKKFDINGSNVYYFKDEDMAYDAMMDLSARDIEISDTNIEESLDENADPCWTDYKIGSPKTKISSSSGKRVNNCVPKDESVNEMNGFQSKALIRAVIKEAKPSQNLTLQDKSRNINFLFTKMSDNAGWFCKFGPKEYKGKKVDAETTATLFGSEGSARGIELNGTPLDKFNYKFRGKSVEGLTLESVNELRRDSLSGTMAGSIESLEDRKYELKKDVKGAQIGDFINVVLPKGSIIYNLPGGVFADHFSLKNKYASKSSRGPQYFEKPTFSGIMIKQKPDTLAAIEKNSKVLESVNESLMSELDILAKEAKNFKVFTMEVFKEFKNLPRKADTLKWLEELYNDAINEAEKAEGDRSKLSADIEKALKDKATESGVPIGLLRLVMRRGLDAWNSSHRAGIPQVAWGYARVNAFLEKGKGTWGKADADIAKEVRDEGKAGKLPIKNPSEFTKKEREA